MKTKETLTLENACSLCCYDKRPVPYIGKKASKIVILGEAPAAEELKQGKPFVGESGLLLNKLLAFIGLKREDVIIANTLRCVINNKNLPQVRQGMKCCRKHLEHLLLGIKPKVIVCLGAIALAQITKLNKVLKYHGTFVKSTEFDCDVFITVHPAHVLRGATKGFPNISYDMMSVREKTIVDDFRLLGQYIKKGFVVNTQDTNYEEVFDFEDFKDSKIVALDFETTSLNYRSNECKALSIALANDFKSNVLVFGKKLPPHLKQILTDTQITKVVAARPFDENVSLHLLGTPIKGKTYDVLTMAHLIDENAYHSFTLENIANTYTSLKNIKDVAEGMRSNLGDADRKVLINYNGIDADATIRAFNQMYQILHKETSLLNYLENFINPIQDMLSDISNNGVLINQELLAKTQIDLTNEANTLHEESKQLVPKKLLKQIGDNYSLTKNEVIQQIMFLDPLGFKKRPMMFTPKTKAPSVDEAHLKMFSNSAFATKVLEWRKIYKLLRTFVPMITNSIHTDGKVYPSISLTSTRTGRSVMRDPHIQILPARGSLAKLLKQVFVADDGWLLGARDLSQSEIRIMGWLANDFNILDAIRRKIDIHIKTAATVNKVPIQAVTSDMRNAAKGINFGFLYGMFAPSFKDYAKTEYGLDYTLDECVKIRTEFFAYPHGYYGLPKYYNQVENFLRTYGYVVSPLGRKRRLPAVWITDNKAMVAEAIRQAINFSIQSFSSDLGLIGMYLFWKEYTKSKVLRKAVKVFWFIHDNIIFSAKKPVFDDAMQLLKHCMEVASKEYIKEKFGVSVEYTIDSDAKSGTNWGNLTKY